MTRKICFVTGTRAEYGLLRWLMADLKADPAVTTQVIACATHLSHEFGNTYKVIEADGHVLDAKVEMLIHGDTPVAIAKSMGVGCIGFADAFSRLAPDIVVVLGDRYEILAAAEVALVARIPLAHIHGGERTEGAVDESIRHAVTKMAHLHFTATDEYRARVIQLGEQPDRVFTVGALGLDTLRRETLPDRGTVAGEIGFPLHAPFLMVTYHPETLGASAATDDLGELLDALDYFPDLKIIITAPNADAEGGALLAAQQEYAAARPGRVHFTLSLGNNRYLALVRDAAAVVGNSSSGLYEAPALATPTVNIGGRQGGRVRPKSVIDCGGGKDSIRAAIERAISPEFRSSLADLTHPFGDGEASARIAEVLTNVDLAGLVTKRFYDIPLAPEALA